MVDERYITIRATAATEKLADAYRQDLPDLVDIGPARPYGRRLERRPRTTPTPPRP